MYFNDYLSSERGMSVEGATVALTLFGIGGMFGQLVSLVYLTHYRYHDTNGLNQYYILNDCATYSK